MNWLHYLLEANIYLGVFYIAYCLFLNKETHYVLNRIYLVCSCVIAFVLPILQLGVLIPPPAPVAPAAFMAVPVTTSVTSIVSAAPVVTEQHFTLQDGLWYVYLAGTAIFALLFIIKLITLAKLVIGKPVLKHTDYNVIYINEANTAFSFFNYLFIGKDAPDKNIITRHELVHIRQKHSADIVFLEVLKIISWFNPLIYLIQGSLKTVHEYIADEQSVDSKDDALTYSSFLVNNAYGLTGPSITHSFFTYNLLKKRIIMLNQQRSGNLARLKYLLVVPIGVGLLCASTLGFSKTYGWIDIAPRKDPGIKIADISNNESSPVNNNAYAGLTTYITKNMRYKIEDAGKSGFILVDFALTKDHKIGNVKVWKSVPQMNLNNQLKTLFNTYNGVIDDVPGHHTLSVVFNADYNNNIELSPEIKKLPGYAGELNIQVPPPPPAASVKHKTDGKISFFSPPPPPQQPKPKVDKVKFPIVHSPAGFKPEKTYVNAKGFKIQEGIGHLKGNLTYYEVIISDPSGKDLPLANDGSHKRFIAFKGLADAEKTAFSLYGYQFPDVKVSHIMARPNNTVPINHKTDQVRFPPPIIRPDKRVVHEDVVKFPPPIVKGDKSMIPRDFTPFLGKNIRYPKEARENNIMGSVIAEFKIDENNHITGTQILKGIGHGCDEEVLRVLNAYPGSIPSPNATYIIALSFTLSYGDNAPPLPPVEPISNKIKNAPNYIGEVVIVAYASNTVKY